MFRGPLKLDTTQGERHFRWRGADVSRLEALTDAVFASLLLTLGGGQLANFWAGISYGLTGPTQGLWGWWGGRAVQAAERAESPSSANPGAADA